MSSEENGQPIPIRFVAQKDESAGSAIARARLEPTVQGALTTASWGNANKIFADTDINGLVAELQKHAKAVNANELGRVEETLATEMQTLDLIFNELARVARLNLFDNLGAAERILKLALKAQSQARCTAEAIAELKNPRPFVAVAQANVAHGPQQVNNGIAGPVHAPGRAREESNSSNELLEHRQDEQRLDARAASLTSSPDQAMEPVEAVNGTTNGSREGKGKP